MESFTPELLEKARDAKSAEELLTLAQENNIEDFTEEAAKAYFALLHPATGEVADEELASVTGGGCYNKGELVVTVLTRGCDDGFQCKHCGKGRAQSFEGEYDIVHDCTSVTHGYVYNRCGNCKYCAYKRGLWLCTNPKKRK